MASDFQERIVLVTGAGSGIGREAALAFAGRGATVYCAGRGERNLAETREMILAAGSQAHVASVDVSEESQVAKLVSRIELESGRLDVAFNNAGIAGGAHRFEDYPSKEYDEVLKVNLKSVFLGMKYQLPLMRRGGRRCNLQHRIRGSADRSGRNVRVCRLKARNSRADSRGVDGERRLQHSRQHVEPGLD